MAARIFKPLTAALIGSVLFAASAQACSRNLPAGANAAIAPGGRIDQPLIDASVRAEVNYHRCKAGLSKLSAAKGLRKVAGTHAQWMARAQNLSHKSRVSGQATTVARIRASGLRFRAGSENIGLVSHYQIDGKPFKFTDRANCGFASRDGKAIPPHSYASLARTIVNLWMASAVHRRNILDQKVSYVGSGLGFDPKAGYCGRFYVSQNFAG